MANSHEGSIYGICTYRETRNTWIRHGIGHQVRSIKFAREKTQEADQQWPPGAGWMRLGVMVGGHVASQQFTHSPV